MGQKFFNRILLNMETNTADFLKCFKIFKGRGKASTNYRGDCSIYYDPFLKLVSKYRYYVLNFISLSSLH